MPPGPYHRPLLRLRRQRLYIPDALRILLNASVATEEAHPRHARDALGDPLVLILVRLVDERVRLDITIEVVADKVIVAVVADGADEGRELVGVTESVGLDGLEDFDEVRVYGVGSVVVRVTQVFDVFGQVAKEEDVVLADLAGDFDLVED